MQINIRKYLLLITLLILPATTFAKDPLRTIDGVVTKISDGDTVHLTDGMGTKLKVRLYGIDAPETSKGRKPGQPYGDEAETALRSKVFRRKVRLDVMDIDRYKRSVGIIYFGGRNINREMVAEGWAWAYRQYLDRPHASEYIVAEEQARKHRLGLWQQNNPQPPWEFRKERRGR